MLEQATSFKYDVGCICMGIRHWKDIFLLTLSMKGKDNYPVNLSIYRGPIFRRHASRLGVKSSFLQRHRSMSRLEKSKWKSIKKKIEGINVTFSIIQFYAPFFRFDLRWMRYVYNVHRSFVGQMPIHHMQSWYPYFVPLFPDILYLFPLLLQNRYVDVML